MVMYADVCIYPAHHLSFNLTCIVQSHRAVSMGVDSYSSFIDFFIVTIIRQIQRGKGDRELRLGQ